MNFNSNTVKFYFQLIKLVEPEEAKDVASPPNGVIAPEPPEEFENDDSDEWKVIAILI